MREALSREYGPLWTAGQWFCYQAASFDTVKYCQVDGLLDSANLIVVEIKIRHVAEAYFQLYNLYLPVVQAAYPIRSVALCEVTKWYDPFTAFPGPVKLVEGVHLAQPGTFSVHIQGG